MTNDPAKPPVRTRVRIITSQTGAEPGQRLVAEPVNGTRKKRKPNSGSMKPGETRNPRGRPKGAKGTKAMVRTLLAARTTIRDGGKPRKVTLYHALLLKELQLAFDGDWRARQTIVALGRWALPEELPHAAANTASEQDKTDQEIIDWFIAEVQARDRSGAGQ